MCCLFGIIDYKHNLNGRQKSKILSVLSIQSETRGTDATGIAYNSDGKLHIYKRPLAAHKMKLIIPNETNIVMGHTRMTTQGDEKKNYNNHPFQGMIKEQKFVLAHNGVLRNDLELKRLRRLPPTKIETDSYIAVQLIEEKQALNLESLKNMAEQVEGTFVFTVLDEKNNLYFIKGNNPLCIYHYRKTGILLYASTEDILKSALKKLKLPFEQPKLVDLSCGDILRINHLGQMKLTSFNTDNLFSTWNYSWESIPYFRKGNTMPSYDDSESLYISEIKSIASAFGYSSEEIDILLDEGFTPEELEECFYSQEL